MPQISYLPKSFPLDSGSNLMAGAKAYWYITLTTTPKDTYTDYALSVANTNPVVADGNGIFPTTFLKNDVRYRLTLKTSADVLIYTQDDIGGPVITQAELGAILYPRTAAELAAGVTPTNYVYPELNVLRYGADATGSTDSGPAANTAIAVMIQKVASIGVAGTMVWPAGTFKIATQIAITNDTLTNFSMVGAGYAATKLVNAIVGNPAEPAIKVTSRNAFFLFMGFQVVGNRLTGAAGNGHAIALLNPDGVGVAGVNTFYPQYVMLRDIGTQYHTGTGKDFAGASIPACGVYNYASTVHDMDHCTSYSDGMGVRCFLSEKSHLNECTIDGATSINTITAITKAASAVVTINTVSSSNPAAIGMLANFGSVVGMVEINGLTGTITAVGGASGAWTFTVNINSSAFTVYASGGTAMVGFGVTGLYVDSCQDFRFLNGTLNGCGLGQATDGLMYVDSTGSVFTNGVTLADCRAKQGNPYVVNCNSTVGVICNLSVHDCDLRHLVKTGSGAITIVRLSNGVRNASIKNNYLLIDSSASAGIGIDVAHRVSGANMYGLEIDGNEIDAGIGATVLAGIRLNEATNTIRSPRITRNSIGSQGANAFTVTDAIRLDGNIDNAIVESNTISPQNASTVTNAINIANSGVRWTQLRNNSYDTVNGTITNQVVEASSVVGTMRIEGGLWAWANAPFVVAPANNATLTTAGQQLVRCAPAGNVTGIILQAGTRGGQPVAVLNTSAFTMTFAASGTSNVADGVADVIAATSLRFFVWDAAGALWYRAQ